MKMTVDEIYDRLVNDDKILTQKGRITFHLGDINIIVKQRDVVGNIMQEWVQGWLDKNQIAYKLNDNTQMPPDFYLDPDNKREGLMEIKAFNYKAAPGFDIADFRMYEREIAEKPWMLDVTYLIFGYDMSDDGVVTIKKIWKNKVWEMARPMYSGKGDKKTLWPINLQIKQGVVHKMRPAKWYGKSKFKTFENKEDFLAALEETVYMNKDTRDDAPHWKSAFMTNYERHYGKKIFIPRWYDIAEKYLKK